MVFSQFGAFLAVGTVVQVDCQLSCLHMSLYLLLPVVDQGGRADDQSSFRDHKAGVWMMNKKQNSNCTDNALLS